MHTLSEQIKLVAIDIDGTLLDPMRQITPRALAAIQAAQEAGIIVTLATGRRYCNTLPIADELGIDIPLILCDGAMIMEHPRGNVLKTHPLQAEIAQQAVELLASHNLQPVVHHINDGIEEIWTGHTQFDNTWSATYLSAFLEDTIRRMDYEALCNGWPDPLRVVAFASEEAIYALIPEVSTLSCSWNAVKSGNYGCSELAVMAPACSKALGLTTLASLLDIPLTQVMAIGDNHNDLEMLQVAGWGVAMGQAPEAVKAVAHAVTASNREDGLALAIERYALRC
ncbi:MAG TPA: Cof-type HAD-IIB family hydrolase [Ktedonosporobacter sp.]|jgi:Cof subfamily protein (haloacid dehalogenase superfamily)|nr:Cof-type HAD-IIB family hydrolase [Ktedonosporobacter sp.]